MLYTSKREPNNILYLTGNKWRNLFPHQQWRKALTREVGIQTYYLKMFYK